ncbi:MAG: hypothetical protein K6G72_11625 [Lachnospiraceae bacterium]|nr:hypothetical protein [Lachnospiraceae bacterium]
MFDFGIIRYIYLDVFFSSFSLIILIAAAVLAPIGIWALKTVKRNLWGIGIAFVLYLLTLLVMCYEKSGLEGIFYGSIFSDIFLGAIVAFIISIIVKKIRDNRAEEQI